ERPLRLWREYRGLTLQALADRVGISKSYLSQIESGDRNGSIEVMKRIAAALDVSLDELV
ncbi:MAG TPA: XRE family transcriptional regulator, partial [Anaerolineae bacterium]|nr:XRE family transcriptional regulator [Anaerolineae bacterium]